MLDLIARRPVNRGTSPAVWRDFFIFRKGGQTMLKQIVTTALAIALATVIGGHSVHAAVISDTGATTEGSITLTAGGAITLDAAPDLDFGTQAISTTKATYTTAGSTPIMVTNPGFASGWNVSVAASKFMNGSTELKGAELTVNDTKIAAADSTNLSDAPIGNATTITPGGSAVSVLNAKAGTGVGVWTSTWGNVSLAVPAGNVAGNYQATLTWTLENAPK